MGIEWKKDLQNLLDNGVNIMNAAADFSNKYNVSMKDIWDYVFDEYKPKPLKQCEGCRFWKSRNTKNAPCNKCSRKVKLKDYYEKETS